MPYETTNQEQRRYYDLVEIYVWTWPNNEQVHSPKNSLAR